MVSQPRTLTIHIGAPKTGSTFVQRLLYDNRLTLLRQQGILYPDVSLRGFGHHDLAFLLGGGYPDWAIPQIRPLEALSADLRQAVSGHDGSIILSSEDFYLFPQPEGLRRLLQECGALDRRELRILVYIRRQDDAHESWYNQIVKAQGATCSVTEYIERNFGLWDYHARLAHWAATFGIHSLCIRRYDPAAFNGGSLRSDFLEQVGIADRDLVSPPGDVNWSLNRDLLAFQRLLNHLPVTPVRKRRFHRQLMDLGQHTAGKGVFDERPLLGARERRAIMVRYADSNAALAREFLHGTAPFPNTPGGGADLGVPAGGLTSGKMAAILHWLWRHG